MRRRVVVSDSEDDEPAQAPRAAQEDLSVRRLAPAPLSDDRNLASGDHCGNSGGNGRSCSDPGGGIGGRCGAGSDVGGAEGADLGDCLDDDALAAALGATGSVGELTPVITGATGGGGTGGATAGASGSVAASAGKIRDVVGNGSMISLG